MASWTLICRSLAAMASLAYLRITISEECFDLDSRSPDENIRLINELLEPLKSIAVTRGGQFDVVMQGWRVLHDIGDAPFQLLTERPPITEDAKYRFTGCRFPPPTYPPNIFSKACKEASVLIAALARL